MEINQKFLVVKDNDSKEIRYFDYDKIRGYNLFAKDNMHFEDAIDVNRIIIIKPTFIEKIATKKMNKKFQNFINMVSVVCDMESADETGEAYQIALDEANKLRMEILNKYKKYITKEKLELMLKKISIIEEELKLRVEILINTQKYNEKTVQKGR